jgi:GNAT superfamily N-acetyltransferase
MPTTQRPYTPDDFVPARNLLSDTWAAWGLRVNWGIERWNWCRYSCVPYLVNYPRNLSPTPAESLAGIRLWEERIGVWAAENGVVVGLVNAESTELGDCWIQRRPGYEALLPEALTWAEAHLATAEGKLGVWAQDHDAALNAVLAARGYVREPDESDPSACYAVARLPDVTLPAGFRVASMAEEGDPLRRAEGLRRGFGHPNPTDCGTAEQYRGLLDAPDYNPWFDLHAIAPGGSYASQCLLWHDIANRIGILEPVATHPDYRRLGLGRAVVYEAIRRVAARGATEVWVGSSQPFYLSIGFEVQCWSRKWVRPAR